jgi:hypothetical protein
VILTNINLDGPDSGIRGYASKGRGAIINLTAEGYVLAHELGHSAGYKGDDPKDEDHDKVPEGVRDASDLSKMDETSLMGPNGGGMTPKQWCEKMKEMTEAINKTRK